MFLNILKEKEFLVLNYLFKNNTISLNAMVEDLKLSHGSIRSALKEINYFLEKYEQKKIKLNNGLVNFDLESLKNFKIPYEYFNSSLERKAYIITELIFNDLISLNSLTTTLDISLKTLNSDIEEIKKILIHFNLIFKSEKWKGCFLEGNPLDKLRFALSFMASLEFRKIFNSNFQKSFDVFNSNIVYKNLKKYISEEILEKAESFSDEILKKLSQNFLDHNFHLYFYHFALSFTILTTTNKFQSLFINTNLKKSKQTDELILTITEVLEKYPEFYFLKENIESFISILYKVCPQNTAFLKKTIFFFRDLRKCFNINLTKKSKRDLYFFCWFSLFKSLFNLDSYFLRLAYYPAYYSETAFTIEKLYCNYFGKLYEEDLCKIMLLVMTFKDNFSKNPEKKILILDSTLNNNVGKFLKYDLETNYNVSRVDISLIFSKLDWDYINNNYDIIFQLNTLNKYNDKIKISCHYIYGMEPTYDKFFFNQFGVKSKIVR